MNAFKNLFFLFLLLIPAYSFAQMEVYGKLNKDGSFDPIIDYGGAKKISEKLSITYFGLVREQWAQALIGVSYSINKSVIVSSSMGIETGTNAPRYSSSVWLGKNNTSLLVLGELGSGKDNYLYKINLFHRFTERFSSGATAWRYHGIGPNFRYLIPKLDSTFWIMPAYDVEINQSRVMVGILMTM
jgi:hypothetical protein